MVRDRILAASPFFYAGEGAQYRRLIIKEWNTHTPYAVQKEYVNENGESSFGDGNYVKTIEQAWDLFKTRTDEQFRMYEVANYDVDRLVKFFSNE